MWEYGDLFLVFYLKIHIKQTRDFISNWTKFVNLFVRVVKLIWTKGYYVRKECEIFSCIGKNFINQVNHDISRVKYFYRQWTNVFVYTNAMLYVDMSRRNFFIFDNHWVINFVPNPSAKTKDSRIAVHRNALSASFSSTQWCIALRTDETRLGDRSNSSDTAIAYWMHS